MGGSTYNSRSNEITELYYRTLVSHEWSKHKAYKVLRVNGNMKYYTYHLWGVL